MDANNSPAWVLTGTQRAGYGLKVGMVPTMVWGDSHVRSRVPSNADH